MILNVNNNVLFVVLLLVLHNVIVECKRNKWKIERLECPDTPACLTNNCTINRPERNKQSITFACVLRQPLERISLHLKSFSYQTAIGYRPHYIDYTTDFCASQADARSMQNPLWSMIMSYMSEYSNFNRKCPISGTAQITDMHLDALWSTVAMLPTARYRIDVRIFDTRDNSTLYMTRLFATWG